MLIQKVYENFNYYMSNNLKMLSLLLGYDKISDKNDEIPLIDMHHIMPSLKESVQNISKNMDSSITVYKMIDEKSGLPFRGITCDIDNINLPFEKAFYLTRAVSREDNIGSNVGIFLKEDSAGSYSGVIHIETFSDDQVNQLPIIVKFDEDREKYYIGFLAVNTQDKQRNKLIVLLSSFIYQIDKLNTPKLSVRYKGRTSKMKLKKLDNSKYFERKYVYVYLDKTTTSVPKEYSKEKLVRETSWLVRGHWRRLINSESVGKNNKGERNVKGFTWVIPHQVGEGKLIVKPHVVKGGSK